MIKIEAGAVSFNGSRKQLTEEMFILLSLFRKDFPIGALALDAMFVKNNTDLAAVTLSNRSDMELFNIVFDDLKEYKKGLEIKDGE